MIYCAEERELAFELIREHLSFHGPAKASRADIRSLLNGLIGDLDTEALVKATAEAFAKRFHRNPVQFVLRVAA